MAVALRLALALAFTLALPACGGGGDGTAPGADALAPDGGGAGGCAAVACDPPADACRVAVCDPATGACVERDAADGTACPTTDPCLAGACRAGRCETAARGCDDGDPCTTDACLAGRGCASTPLVCDDGDPCTTDGCDPARGCVATARDCDDGDACTADRCDAAQGCVSDPLVCDDGDLCTTDACDPALGCLFATVTCEAADACTVGSCAPGAGCVFATRDCDDGDACTTDACDPATGCTATPVTCEPSADACIAVACEPAEGCVGRPRACDDGDACTTDACDAASGCLFVPVGCDDQDACTADTCDPVTGCGAAPVTCDDGDACTIDACEPALGCVTTPLPCDDGDPCTADGCDPLSGCAARPIGCNDGDACTADACDPATGECTHAPGPCLPEDRCADGVDDDGDGGTDCDDADCAEDEACVAPCVDDALEDNDLRATATLVGPTSPLADLVARADDVDWYLVDVCSGGTLRLDVAPAGAAAAPDLVLLDAAGAFIAGGVRGPLGVRLEWLSSVDGPVYARVAAGPGAVCVPYTLTVSFAAAGCGALFETCTNGRDDDGDGRADCADADCAAHAACGGGTCTPSGALACGGAVFGDTQDGRAAVAAWDCSGWDESGPEQAWTLTPTGDGVVTVTLDTAADLDVFVLEDDCAAAACLTYGDGGATFFGVAGRAYHVVVDGFAEAAGTYTLSAECAGGCADDAFEPNDTPIAAAALEGPGPHAAVLAPGDPDWFHVERCTGAHVQATATAAAGAAFTLRLFDDDGAQVGQAAAVDGRATVSATATWRGAWRLEVAAGAAAPCTAYAVAVTLDESGCATESDCADGVDDDGDGATDCADPDCEGAAACAGGLTCAAPAPVRCGETVTGDTRGGASRLSAYACAAQPETGAEHVYGLTLAEDGPVTVTLTGMAADLDLFLLAGTCAAESCVAVSNGLSFERVTFAGTAGVPYFVVVDGYEGAADAYALSVDAEHCAPLCTPVCGARTCGPDPLCGLSCGECAAAETCAAGRCRPAACEGLPATGCCDGAAVVWCDEGATRAEECAPNEPPADGCGWSAAAAYVACGGADVPPAGVVTACPPPCVPAQSCAALGRTCGPHPQCPERSCGACATGFSCDDGSCAACDPVAACAGVACGPGDCGLDCGGCAEDRVCVLSACEAPGSRSCATPAPLACGETREGDTAGGLPQLAAYACAPVTEAGAEDVYAFAAAATGTVTVTLTATGADLDLFVLAATCDGEACVAGSAGLGTEEVVFDTLAGETYYVVVDTFGAATARYTLTTSCQ